MSRARAVAKVARRALSALAVGAIFASAAATGVVVHLDLPAARRLLATRLNDALAGSFRGRLVIDRVARLGLNGFAGVDLHVVAPDGAVVLRAQGVAARFSSRDIARSLLWGNGPILIRVDDVSVDNADIAVDHDKESGQPKLASAFAPRAPSSEARRPDARGLRLALASVHVEHAWVHGETSGTNVDAEIGQLAGSLHVAPDSTTLELARVHVLTRNAPSHLDLDVEMHARVALPSAPPSTVRGAGPSADLGLAGAIGGVPVSVALRLADSHVDASADVPAFALDKLKSIVPGVVTGSTASAHVEAHGDLPRIHVTADILAADAKLHATTDLVTGEPFRADTLVEIVDLDLGKLLSTAPHTSLGATARASMGTQQGGSFTGTFAIDVKRGKIGPNDVPAATFGGDFAQRTMTPTGPTVVVNAHGHVDEPGAPTEVTVAIHPDAVPSAPPSSLVLDVATKTRILRLGALRGIAGRATGSADVALRTTVHLATGDVDASLDADLHELAQGSAIRVEHGHAVVRAHGNAAAPLSSEIQASLSAEGIEAGDFRYASGIVTARGTPGAVRVDAKFDAASRAEPDLHAQATVNLAASSPKIRAATVTLDGRGRPITLSAETIVVAKGDVGVDRLRVEGLGRSAEASAHFSSHGARIRILARGLQVDALARAVGLRREVHGGRVDLDVDLLLDQHGAEGHVYADVTRLRIATAPETDAKVQARFHERTCDAAVHVAVADIARADVTTNGLTFAGKGPLTLDSWRQAVGQVELATQIDLARLYAALPNGTLPVSELGGTLSVSGSASRDGVVDAAPELSVTARTTGLVVAETAPVPAGAAPRRLSGVDVEVVGSIAGQSGATRIAARLLDGRGQLASFDAHADSIPFADLLSAVPGGALRRLETVPFVATAAVAKRALADLPTLVALPGAKGSLEAALTFSGTAREPQAHLTASASGVTLSDGVINRPLDASLDTTYDGRAAEVRLDLRSPKAALAETSAHIDVAMIDLLDRAGAESGADTSADAHSLPLVPTAPIPWKASAHARLLGAPLATLTPLSDHGVHGKVTGAIDLEDLHGDAPHLHVDLAASGVKVNTTEYAGAKLVADIANGRSTGLARVDQANGFLEAQASAETSWRGDLVPTLDTTRPIDASLTAKQFRAAGLLPLVDATLTELDGTLDGVVRASVAPRPGKPPSVAFQGALALKEGRVELASTGTELHDARATLTFAPDGLVRLDDFSAHGLTGTVSASANARLDGLRLVGANANVHIPKGQAVPIDVGGAALGTVSADISAKAVATADPRVTSVEIDVPTLAIALPLSESHAVHDLEEMPNVHVGTFAGPKPTAHVDPQAFVALAIDGRSKVAAVPDTVCAEYDVTVRLKEVLIARGTSLKVALDGTPVAKIACTTAVTGQIRLRSGTLEVQGKRFEIEKGTVTFVGRDASNPDVVVTAAYTAPDGTRVYADFLGPLKTGKVTLRSEPPRPKNEILALIVFGSAEGSESTPYGSAGTAGPSATAVAGSAAGSFATEGLSQGIDDLTGLDVATKVDTTNAASPRPEIEVQIARTISLQIAFVLGTPPPGANPDRTFATIDWRFLRQWSLETTFGDQGSSLADIVWQYRY